MQTQERVEMVRHRQKKAKENITQIVKVLTIQKVIEAGVFDMIKDNLNAIEDDPYSLIFDLNGCKLEVEQGPEKQRYIIETKVTVKS